MCTGMTVQSQQKAILWYDSPAQHWEEALPLGNGRLGAMVYGDPVNEEIQLNEETVSAGSPYKNYNSEAKEALPAIRKLIFDGNYAEAQLMAGEKILWNALSNSRESAFAFSRAGEPYGLSS